MIHDLEKLGLTPGESKVYIALLKLGPSKVGKVVKESGVSYSKVYDVLERLAGKGLASETLMDKVKHYRAVEPFRLSEYIKKKEDEVEEQKKLLDKIMGDLQALGSTQEKSKAEVFFGMDGLKTAHQILLTSDENVLRFFFPDHTEKAATFYKRFYPKFEEKGIQIRGIGRQVPELVPTYMKVKAVSFPVPGTIDVIGDKTLLVSWRDNPTAVLIHSKEIADHFINYFDSVWEA